MDALFFVTAAGLGVMWWQSARRRRAPEARPVDEALEIAMHVAVHEAEARRQAVHPLHLLYGMLQDEDLRATAARLGRGLEAMERHVFDALDRCPAPDPLQRRAPAERAVARAMMRASGTARPAGLVHLFASLLREGPAAEEACAAAGFRGVDLLFLMVHGVLEADSRRAPGGDVEVVLVNDDFTTMEMVVEILKKDFELDEPLATEIMKRTHHEGRAVVGRYGAAEGRALVEAGTRRARAQDFPLWIRLEAA